MSDVEAYVVRRMAKREAGDGGRSEGEIDGRGAPSVHSALRAHEGAREVAGIHAPSRCDAVTYSCHIPSSKAREKLHQRGPYDTHACLHVLKVSND